MDGNRNLDSMVLTSLAVPAASSFRFWQIRDPSPFVPTARPSDTEFVFFKHPFPYPRAEPPSYQHAIGRISAWTCTTLYLTSRRPQIWKDVKLNLS